MLASMFDSITNGSSTLIFLIHRCTVKDNSHLLSLEKLLAHIHSKDLQDIAAEEGHY